MNGSSYDEGGETGGREDRLLPWGRVRDIAGISRTTAWRLQQAGDFPKPVPVSPGRVCWWESELTAWKATRGAIKPLKPPSRPRLAGMPRRRPVRAEVGPLTAADSKGDLPVVSALDAQSVEAAPPRGRRRRLGPASPNQLDFNF